MLVIRRRAGESIWVGDVEVAVIETTPHRVKLGFRGPQEVVVIRGELKATLEENCAAARLIGNAGLAQVWDKLRKQKGAGQP